MPAKPVIAISAGDPAGIGPEITAKALADPSVAASAQFIVFGLPDPARPSTAGPTADGGRASFDAVMRAIEACKRPRGSPGAADAMVTAPVSKEAWHAAGIDLPGHTELLAREFASPDSGMLFVGPSLRVLLATIHVPLTSVPALITRARIASCIDLAHRACLGLGVARPRIAVAGLNPHAGERGLFGREDLDSIAPAIAEARARGLDVSGPWPGDVVFLQAVEGRHDLVIAMYHDQGLIPMKLLDRRRTVNMTAGLTWQGRTVVRTSPAHGTAFDIAGTSTADPASMVEAIRLAVRLAGAS
ncbi:MAG: 4-hydroxythreonine-4-phosphate dehydrogenase PdxA [Phycisphaeraceae bacterium]|nr:4-hydroxythreonine-4-phosphate dehydrogenase PdxA [Phycisphaeraceae bacterium]